VLKSEYNLAWDYFNAKKLGDIVLGTWRNWITAATHNRYSIVYPKFSSDLYGLKSSDEEFNSLVETTDGFLPVPDITKIGFDKRRFIVSKKRTRNLFDLTSLWKKTVLSKMEEQALEQNMSLGSNDDEPANDSSDDNSSTGSLERQDLSFQYNIRGEPTRVEDVV
jgi:hypothetical protein